MEKLENGTILVLAGILALGCIIGGAIYRDHIEDMEHIKQNHCYVQIPGGVGQWEICKQ